MASIRYQSLGPLLSGEGSRAFLGLAVSDGPHEPPFPVVLVWIPKDVLKDKSRLDSILKETKRATQLEHPNIVKVYGLTSQPQGLARVVEYANAESLRRLLEAKGKLPVDIAVKLVADAATGVHYAHLAGNDDGTPLVHADIRPQTLLVTYTGVCKVSGYGALAAAPREVGGRRVPGRRHHCAPEQVLGGRNAVNVQTDVYLLGLVLFECLTGRVPFEDEKSEPDFDQAVLNRPLPELPDTVPEPVRAVVRKAMAKRAFDRYPSVLAMREALEQAMQPLPGWEAVADLLAQLFPENHPTREARRRLVEKGLAVVASFASLPPEPVEPGAPPPPPKDFSVPAAVAGPAATPAPAPPAPSKPSAAPAPKAAPATPPPAAAGPPPPPLFAGAASSERRSPVRVFAAFGAVVVALAAAGAVLYARDRGWTAPAGLADAGTDAGNADAGEGDAGVDAGEPDAGPAVYDPDSGIPAVDISVEPRVGVSLDGQYIGRSPVFYWPVTPGRHSVGLQDRSQGINLGRSVNVADAGVTRAEFFLGKGYINVNAPAGAEVTVDGRSLGKAPLKDVGVYEGNHHIVVTVNASRWEEGFEIVPHQHLSFTVDFE
ncbi:MAG TPA: serine/threonine-protein kinase [Myxococcaceae bacterium]|jgi:serine/threonine-protein kinase